MNTSKSEGVSNPSFTGDNHQEIQLKERKQSQPKISQISEDDVSLEDCALPCLRLRFLNSFRSPKWFLVFLCLAATTQGLCINGLVNVVITSIETRFGLKSTQSGIIASSYDIGSMLIMLPVNYFGGRIGASKPRFISVGLLFMGLGSLVWTIPHFATPVYNKHAEVSDTGGEKSSLCIVGSNATDALDECNLETESSGSLSNYRFIFILGQLLHGVGAAPLITLGTTFLDESVSAKVSPVYIGIFQVNNAQNPYFILILIL